MFELARIVLMFGSPVGSALETIPVAEVSADRPVNPGTSEESSGRFELNWAVLDKMLFTAATLLVGTVKPEGKPVTVAKADVKADVGNPVNPGMSEDRAGRFELNWAELLKMLFTAATLLVGTAIAFVGRLVGAVKPGIRLDTNGKFEEAKAPLLKMLFNAATLLVGAAITLAGRAFEEGT